MTDKIEEVKKILERNFVLPGPSEAPDWEAKQRQINVAQQICQLFEPKPDESRLLTKDDECRKRIQAIEETLQNLHSEAQEKWVDNIIRLEEKKDTECQKRVERVRQEIMGIDCMEDIADIRKAITALVYSLKKQEEVKDG